ncbi:glycosyl-4,4'-diaponeurosporenoate acyltransferase [Halobacillus salinarum]|uniref:Glycosyl-4,4'-diaponeurosporenoate acyltransferase n=1 Tax=Halobacillus salinarum TaxID=2932257 RepID=A0ABY4ERG2_9BACI|nr:glycosyl-4,4'-diaponeurosporenoate acyltransferase [Halobacillus salinarum]UOQ46565.1 glycosyl-4,4'-diaponeurosporenoate acyltransferase [Halobacillus salinarum]
MINSAAWLVIHISLSIIIFYSPNSLILSAAPLYKLKNWEKGGAVYEKIRIKKWKPYLPEARKWRRAGKSAKYLRSLENVQQFEMQTNRSELSHWLQILPAPFFFFFNSPVGGCLNVTYAILFNLPFIIIQRYNRSRLEKLRAFHKEKP